VDFCGDNASWRSELAGDEDLGKGVNSRRRGRRRRRRRRRRRIAEEEES